jgi:transposase
LRRRHRLVRIRSECYTHIQNTFSQNGILDVNHSSVKSKKSRRKLIQRFDDPELQATIEADLDMIEFLDPKIRNIEIQVFRQAKHHNRRDLNILLSIPGVGETIALIILYEIHRIDRFPTVQNFSSYARLVKCDRSSAGKKSGGRGHQKIGNPYLKWAFSEIITKAKITSPVIAKFYQRLQSKFGPGRARSIIAHRFGVAVYFMLKNGTAFDENLFVQTNMK